MFRKDKLSVKKMIDKKQIKEAEQQFMGFALGSQGYRVIELVSSMDLKEEEWSYLKRNKMVNNLSKVDVKEINEYFKQINAQG